MDADRAAQLLAAERERIEHHLARLRGEMPSDSLVDDVDPGDQAYDINERERDAGRISELEDELRALERAEARLADGTYGLSVESGEPISDARLERLPAAERTAYRARQGVPVPSQAMIDRSWGTRMPRRWHSSAIQRPLSSAPSSVP